MGLYIGTKIVQAKPMNRLEYNQLRGWELPADEDGSDEGYLVEYTDGGRANVPGFEGYVSWSPRDVFARAYRSYVGASFGVAIVALQAGLKVAREGWNGKGMFLYYVGENSYPAQTDAAKEHFGDMVPYRAYIAMKTVDNEVVPWVASQTDILAEDWLVVI